MPLSFKNAAAAVMALFFVGSAHAQVCMESTGGGNGGKVNLTCDMRYRDAVIACDKKNPQDPDEIVGTRPGCPKKPMPMIDTPKRSYVDGYNPYLFVSPRDAKDATLPYTGPYSVGTPGDTSKTFQMIGKSAPGTKRLAACTAQIKGASDPQTPAEAAKLIRLQADACTNEYILNAAAYPYQKENVRLLSMDDPENPAAVMNLAGECQPLKTFRETENEYSASTYLEAAWKKTLQDPKYRKTTPSSIACVPCINDAIPCDREPHLPCGTTIENPAKPANELKNPPEPFPEVLLSSIGSIPYEEIVDPTHPFSPRWDFRATDRDYSTIEGAAKAAIMGSAKVAVNYALMQTYMSKTDNTIFCAGVKEAKEETDEEKKANLEVPVDVLEFRRPNFEAAIFGRTGYNTACYQHKALFPTGTSPLFLVAPGSFCFQITGFSIFFPWIYARDFDCWKCFGLEGKVDDETQHPPCTQNYLGKDLKMKLGIPGGINFFSRTAQCNHPLAMGSIIPKKRDSKYNMDKVCRDLRKPFTPLNKLKMRYHNPNDKDDKDGENVVLKKGALEGMSFGEYFGNHMPYPRLWDKGTSLQKTNSADGNDQPPLDTTGQFTAIVGVGREAAAKAALGSGEDSKDEEDKFSDQRCMLGGWGASSGLVGALSGNLSNVSSAISGTLNNTLNQALGTATGALTNTINGVVNQSVNGAMRTLNGAISGTINQVTNTAFSAFNSTVNGAMAQMLGGTSGAVNAQLTTALRQMLGNATSSYNATLNAAMRGAVSNASAAFNQNVLNGASQAMNGASRSMNVAVSGAFNQSCGSAIDTFNGTMNQSISGLNRTMGQVGSIVGRSGGSTTQFGNIMGQIRGPLSQATGTLNQMNGMLRQVSGTLTQTCTGGLNNALASQQQAIMNAITGGMGQSLNGASAAMNNAIRNELNNAMGSASRSMNATVNSGINQALNGVSGVSPAQIAAFMQTYNQALAAMNSTISGTVGQTVRDGLNTVTNTVNGAVNQAVGPAMNGLNTAVSGSMNQAMSTVNQTINSTLGGAINQGISSISGVIGSSTLSALNALLVNNVKFAGVKVYTPDPLTSWSEFKLYQTRTLRNIGISCVGRYEKVFKPGSAENMMLLGAGADWSPVVISKCTRAQEATGPLRDCKTMTLKEYEDAGSPEADNTYTYMKQLVNTAWPNSWRGYMAAEKSAAQFPNFGGGGSAVVTGLDNAELGDIVMMPNGPSNKTDAAQRGLSKLAMVVEANVPSNSDCEDKKNCYVKVVEPDNGKLPDVCGTTDTWGEMKTRYYYKPGSLPKDAATEYKDIMPAGADSASFSDCLNTGISHCTMNAWSTIKVYRMRDDVRKGCDKDKAIDCEDKEGGQ